MTPNALENYVTSWQLLDNTLFSDFILQDEEQRPEMFINKETRFFSASMYTKHLKELS